MFSQKRRSSMQEIMQAGRQAAMQAGRRAAYLLELSRLTGREIPDRPATWVALAIEYDYRGEYDTDRIALHAIGRLRAAATVPSAATDGRPDDGGKPLVDEFTQLRDFARDQLKGQEHAVIEALCASNGEMPIADLAVKSGVGWEKAEEGFKNARRRLNRKLKKQHWKLFRQNNMAKLKMIEMTAKKAGLKRV
jgi:hypothetical protein